MKLNCNMISSQLDDVHENKKDQKYDDKIQ